MWLGWALTRAYLFRTVAFLALFASRTAGAADLSAVIPTNAPKAPQFYDWTGAYFGGHVGYGAATSRWSATEAGGVVPTLSGSLDFFNTYDSFKGTGSYFAGLQAGYNYALQSRTVLGLEADFSAPSTIAGTQLISSGLIGQASYGEWAEPEGWDARREGAADLAAPGKAISRMIAVVHAIESEFPIGPNRCCRSGAGQNL